MSGRSSEFPVVLRSSLCYLPLLRFHGCWLGDHQLYPRVRKDCSLPSWLPIRLHCQCFSLWPDLSCTLPPFSLRPPPTTVHHLPMYPGQSNLALTCFVRPVPLPGFSTRVRRDVICGVSRLGPAPVPQPLHPRSGITCAATATATVTPIMVCVSEPPPPPPPPPAMMAAPRIERLAPTDLAPLPIAPRVTIDHASRCWVDFRLCPASASARLRFTPQPCNPAQQPRQQASFQC